MRIIPRRKWPRPVGYACLYMVAFVLPMLVLLAVFAAVGIAPFGTKNLLVTDMDGQYVSFFAYYKDTLASGGDFFYTFSKSLGGDMLSFAAYYLLSPFNLVLLPFSTMDLPIGILFLTLLKVGSAGLTCAVFLSLERRERSLPGALLFSMGYALSTYMFAYQQNIIWLDGMIALPVVLLGIRRLVTRRRRLLYILSLAYILVINYYIGYMICIFAVLYFLFQVWTVHPRSPRRRWKARGRLLLRFGTASLLGGGLAAVTLLPSLLSLSGGDKSLNALSKLTLQLRFDAGAFFSKLFTGTFQTQDMWGSTLPMIFCGLFAVVMLILYFFNRRIRKQEKLAAGIWLLLLFAGFAIQALYLVWHAFNFPVGFPSRQAFLFVFTVLYLGYRGFSKMHRGLKLRHLGFALSLFLLLAAVMCYLHYDWLRVARIWKDVALFGGFILLLAVLLRLWAGRPARMRPPVRRFCAAFVTAALILLQGANLYSNGRQVLSQMNYANVTTYPAYVDEVKPVVDAIKEQDDGFYRLEKTFHRTPNDKGRNDPMLFSYNGLSHFCSTEKMFTKNFLGKLGFRNNGNWACYWEGSTFAVDCLLGVKYKLAKSKLDPVYEKLFTEGEITAYENPYALPLGFAVADDVLEADMDTHDLFALQNGLFSSMTGGCADLFVRASNVTEYVTGMTAAEEGSAVRYTRDADAQEAYVEYTLFAEREEPLYAYFPDAVLRGADIYVNDRRLSEYFTIWRYGIVSLGRFAPGDLVTVRLVPRSDTLQYSAALFCYEDMTATREAVVSLRRASYQIEEYTNSYFTGTITVSEARSRLLLTIPADDGWSVWVDGQKAEPQTVFGALLSVPLTPGTHTVTLRYMPPGFTAGACLSGAVVLYLIGAGLWQAYKKRKAI